MAIIVCDLAQASRTHQARACDACPRRRAAGLEMLKREAWLKCAHLSHSDLPTHIQLLVYLTWRTRERRTDRPQAATGGSGKHTVAGAGRSLAGMKL